MVANEILTRLLEIANQVLPEEEPLLPEAGPFRLPERVLVVPSYFIGDNILLTPFLRNLRRNLGPGTRIDIAASPPMVPFFETFPGVDDVYVEKQGSLRNPRAFLESRRYDTVIMCRYAPMWARAAVRAGIPQRVGYDLERLGIHRLKRWGQSLTHTIPSTSMFDSRPQVEIYLDILRELGMAVDGNNLQAGLTHDDYRTARKLLPHTDQLKVLIHAGSGSPGKNWPAEHWENLLTVLNRRWNPLFVAVGGSAERGLYQSWEQDFDFVNLCGGTNLRESIAVLSHMDLVITLDTSVAHMAALAGVPRLVVLYGPTNHLQWKPVVTADTLLRQVHLPLECRPCPARTCEHRQCIKGLSVGQVLLAIEAIMREKPF